ncbi:MAG: helix-turn-helix domain-containing protein [Defluviitaleaceae bacterium]|nr:helix-turn-helix domain-containing protein [Defluviitaleaceae bacterium]
MRKKFTTGERLKELMRTKNLRQVDILAKTLPYQKSLGIKMSKSHLSNYVNDRSTPDNEKMRLLSKALEISEPWLMGYNIEMTNEPTRTDEREAEILQTYRKLTQPRQEKIHAFVYAQLIEQNNSFKSVDKPERSQNKSTKPISEPIFVLEKKNGTVIYPNVIGAAAGVGTSHYADLDFDELMIPSSEAYEHAYVIPMYVRGDSMEPKYFDGDIIWVDTREKSIDIHQIGVFDTEDGRVVKQMGIDKLISINPEYPDIKLHEYMDFSTYGKVVDVIRREQLEAWQNARWV